jgi:cytochrome b6-f complex iron-sulfur subunit
MKSISRRDFMRLSANGLLAAAGLLGLSGLIRYFSYQSDPAPQTEFDLGPARNFPLDSQTIINYIPAIVMHDRTGYKALSLVCTHLGCTVEQDGEEFACPCHSSRYKPDGTVLRGPAKLNLTVLRVEQTPEGNLHLYTG